MPGDIDKHRIMSSHENTPHSIQGGDGQYDLCIIGGAGHVGLPLGVACAEGGLRTVLFDVNEKGLESVKRGIFPFKEEGGDEALKRVLKRGMLDATSDPESIRNSKQVLIVIGTPIDGYLSPQFGGITRVIDKYISYFRDGQIVILRSTVYPGTTEKVQHYFRTKNKNVRLAFCPERILQGHAIEDLRILPQIVSAFDDETLREVTELFKKTTPADIIPVEPMEAELAKLFTNAWRYIRFAVANQFFMIAHGNGLDYYRIERAMKHDYPRTQDLPSPGFAAGPCLLKDTMQLAAFTHNNFWLGHAAMLVNEGLVNHLIAALKREYGEALKEKTIGILGMAYKGGSDDIRDSLSYKLRKIANVESKRVLCTDPHVKDETLKSLEETLGESDIIILAAPHREYADIQREDYPQTHFIDIWNFWGKP